MFRALSNGPEFPRTREGNNKLCRLLRYAVLPEYALVPFCYVLGWYQQFLIATALQLGFTIGSGTFQYWVFLDGRHGAESCVAHSIDGGGPGMERYNQRCSGLLEPLETVFGISMSRVQSVSKRVFGKPLPKWLYEFVLQLPNYVHVQQTAVVAASSWATWSPALAAEFARRWQDVPLFGWLGLLGLPGLLTWALVLSCAVHVHLAIATDDADEIADAANLLFLGRALPENLYKDDTNNVGFSRLAVAFVAKTPMLWLKVSLLTLTWQCMDGQQRTATLVAVALAWYAVLPAVQRAVDARREYFVFGFTPARWLAFLGIGLLAALMVIFVHMVGLPLCESNDLSVMRGCTLPSHVQLCANSTQ